MLQLLGQGATEFFDDGIRQDFTGNALNFGLSLFAGEVAVQSEFKILALADACETLVAHFLEGTMDGLSLGVENTLFERDVNVRCHK